MYFPLYSVFSIDLSKSQPQDGNVPTHERLVTFEIHCIIHEDSNVYNIHLS